MQLSVFLEWIKVLTQRLGILFQTLIWLNKYLLGADITDVNWVKIYKRENLEVLTSS